ncbi:MAG TPA: class I SAM-dependent methyltransferase [Terriglobia bacterium]|nr:class I SAM-dependent methyltransferase [Terriglobia bacterium]
MAHLSFDDRIGLVFLSLSVIFVIITAWRFREFRTAVRRLAIVMIILMIALVLLHFPYDFDTPSAAAKAFDDEKYYIKEFVGEAAPEFENFPELHQQIKHEVASFVERHALKKKHVLDIGAGTGYLQDIVDDYTGLDIAPAAQRYFHKRFVAGSATALPFPDNEFDAAWSVFVYEHVVNPERGFMEARRVVRNGGLFFLSPAWNCPTWLADGYEVRPYSDFSLREKLVKASLILRTLPAFQAYYRYPIRALRLLSAYSSHGPTKLRYNLLHPNYSNYWEADSDAVNSIDRFEALQWFLSRGDECLNCSLQRGFWFQDGPLILQINKRQ